MTNPLIILEPSDSAQTAPVVLERIVRGAESAAASDIHLQMTGRSAIIFFRLDGVMTRVAELPPEIADHVFGRIKFLARLKTYQDSLPQDGRIDKNSLHCGSDIRVATYPTITGEKIVLRLFTSGVVQDLQGLGFPDEVALQLRRFLAQSSGLLLLTGPAGSGKTTTIYACLSHLVQAGGRHIITVEDPAEQVISGVMQTEINEARGLTFAVASRHLLRQDPQVLVIGEIRDEETAGIAVRASLTGHLVISTLHSGSCKGVLERLNVLCREPSAIASSLQLILSQRLVRRVCDHCHAEGCSACFGTGYRGRLPLVESLSVTESIRSLIADRKLGSVIAQPSLAERGTALISSGLTTRAEIDRVLGV